MSIVFFGTPEFSVPSLRALVESGEKVVAVVTQRDKRRGRSQALVPSPVKEFALSKGLNVLQPASMKDEAFISELRAMKPEFIVVVAYGRILPRALLDLTEKGPGKGAINVHASLLPKYRGASPIAWAIIRGETVTGVTTMLMSEGLDEGDILLEEAVNIEEDDTTESLSIRLSAAGASLLVKTLKGLREGAINPRPQAPQSPQAGEPTFAPPFKKEDGRMDWSKTARELYNFVRGMHPWPGTYFFLDGQRVKLLKAKALDGKGRPGMIERITADEIIVGTGGGLLSLIELQPEGKRPMNAKAFIQGRQGRQGRKILEGTAVE